MHIVLSLSVSTVHVKSLEENKVDKKVTSELVKDTLSLRREKSMFEGECW